MKYSDKGTLVQRQRYPLPSRSLQYWPMNRCVRNTTHDVQCLKIFLFENIFDNGFVTICHFWFQNIFDNFCHFWFNNMFDNCFVIICDLSPYLYKSCLISWQNLFIKHFKFVSWLLVRLSVRLLARLFALAKRLSRVSDRIICMALRKTLSKTRFFTRVIFSNARNIKNNRLNRCLEIPHISATTFQGRETYIIP